MVPVNTLVRSAEDRTRNDLPTDRPQATAGHRTQQATGHSRPQATAGHSSPQATSGHSTHQTTRPTTWGSSYKRSFQYIQVRFSWYLDFFNNKCSSCTQSFWRNSFAKHVSSKTSEWTWDIVTRVRASHELGVFWMVLVMHSFYGQTKTNTGRVSRLMSSGFSW